MIERKLINLSSLEESLDEKGKQKEFIECSLRRDETVMITDKGTTERNFCMGILSCLKLKPYTQ